MLRIAHFSSIHEIEKSDWDSILSDKEFFNSHRFVQIVEQAKVENASFQYLLFYNMDELVGHTVLSLFNISLDLFIPKSRLAHWIKKVYPNFFNVRILFSGLPASLAQLNLKIKEEKWNDPVTNALHQEMERIAKAQNVSLLCVKEFKDREANMCKALTEQGFFTAFSLPYMNLEIKWKTFQDYLAQLRHHYRRAIQLSLDKFDVSEPNIFKSRKIPDCNRPCLVLGDRSVCTPEQMHSMYLSVMERTPTKLETLNLSFFKNLYHDAADTLEILAVQHNGQVVCAALLIPAEDELTFMLVGKNSEKDEFDSYFNLIYGIIQIGIQRKLKRINMGQTAYWVKQRVGATAQPVYIYFKSHRLIMNLLLTKFNKLIFPELVLKPVNVFKQNVTKPVEQFSTEKVMV